ncbi:MAG: YciI family protein [Desulfomonilia bacterium]
MLRIKFSLNFSLLSINKYWKEGPFNETKEVIVGYYHILAEDLGDAIAIAKGNPEFEYGTTARIEVRPIKMKEEDTGFVYPNIHKQR